MLTVRSVLPALVIRMIAIFIIIRWFPVVNMDVKRRPAQFVLQNVPNVGQTTVVIALIIKQSMDVINIGLIALPSVKKVLFAPNVIVRQKVTRRRLVLPMQTVGLLVSRDVVILQTTINMAHVTPVI